MAISISLPSPRMSSSVSSLSSSPSSSRSWSSMSLTRGSSGPSAFFSPSPSASRSRKYRLKSRSNVGWSRYSLMSVAASVALNVSRSTRPTSALAASASSASDGEIRISARRRSPMNSRIRWSRALLRQDLVERALDALEVLLVLHEHRQGRLDDTRIELARVQDHQRARPVQRLRDRRELAKIHRADLLDRRDDGPRQLVRDLRNFQPDDLQLVRRRRKVDEEVQAPALEPVREL